MNDDQFDDLKQLIETTAANTEINLKKELATELKKDLASNIKDELATEIKNGLATDIKQELVIELKKELATKNDLKTGLDSLESRLIARMDAGFAGIGDATSEANDEVDNRIDKLERRVDILEQAA